MAYSVRSDVEMIFGVTNVAAWADLDNDKDPAKIQARIDAIRELGVGGWQSAPMQPGRFVVRGVKTVIEKHEIEYLASEIA